jgi:hypothetical protein
MELCTSTASTAITVSAVWCAVGVGAKSGVLCAVLLRQALCAVLHRQAVVLNPHSTLSICRVVCCI